MIMKLNKAILFVFIFLIAIINISYAYAACSNPSGAAGDQMYNSTHNVMQFCDGTHWTAMKGDGSGGAETDPQVNTLTGNRWCRANAAGTVINCTQTNPVTSETDPQVASVTNGRICKGTGSSASCNVTVPSCTGANRALQWTGSNFSCVTVSGGNAGCPATGIKDGNCQTLTYGVNLHNTNDSATDSNNASSCSGDYYGTFTKKCTNGSWTHVSGSCNYQPAYNPNSCQCTGGCSCFIAGTMVTLADGNERAIELIKAGDLVLGMDGQYNTVTGVEVPPIGDRELYAFNGGNYFVTREHPFMLDTGQWASINPDATEEEQPGFGDKYGAVKSLQVGDTIVLKNGGKMTLETIESRGRYTKTMPVYNLLLDGNHTYYADGFLVHNKM